MALWRNEDGLLVYKSASEVRLSYERTFELEKAADVKPHLKERYTLGMNSSLPSPHMDTNVEDTSGGRTTAEEDFLSPLAGS